VVALAVVWLLLRRPLSCGDIVLVIVVALLVAWMLERAPPRPSHRGRLARWSRHDMVPMSPSRPILEPQGLS
jgi:multisubunit Na+/H+ antiporter MnhE subunit